LPAKQPLRVFRENQISDISRFLMNEVTLMKIPRKAKMKIHVLFEKCGGIHGRIPIPPMNERAIGRKMSPSIV
jgi:hypothetical protein